MHALRRCLLILLACSAGTAVAQQEYTADLLAQGQTVRAIDELETQLGQNPFDPVTLNNLAVARGERGDFFVAADLLRRAHRLAPGHPVIEQNLTQVDAWISHHADSGRITPLSEDRRLRLPPEPPPLWR